MLSVQGLTAAYGENIALRDLSLAVKPGEILGLIGPNGAGKSTLIRAISGVIPLRDGKVSFKEHDLTTIPSRERARILAVVPQARQLGGAFTVEQTVLIGRTAHMSWLGKPSEKDIELAHWAMQKTFTDRLSQRRIAELSGGEQQRVLLARALAQTTPVLLLDEPTNHLDLQHQIEFLKLVRRLADEQNLTVLMAVHDLNLVSLFADCAALLVNGELRVSGTPAEVLTGENISNAYRIGVDVFTHPISGKPLILPGTE